MTGKLRVIGVATATGIHGCNKLKICRVGYMRLSTSNLYLTGFNGLA